MATDRSTKPKELDETPPSLVRQVICDNTYGLVRHRSLRPNYS